jgi:hypothetical protein
MGIEKLELREQYKSLNSPSARAVQLVEVPELSYLAIDGRIEAGVPPGESEVFAESMTAMYGLAYGVKFLSKLRAEDPIDYPVMALEGLWSSESGVFEWGKREPWLYTLLVMQPDHIDQTMLDHARAKAKSPLPAMDRVRLQRWKEGTSIQVMHVGPYSEEPRSLAMMEAYVREHDLEIHGRHHEIYLSDPRRAKPESLKTILRHPVRRPPH